MSRRRSILFLAQFFFKVLAHAVVALPWKRRQKLERTWYTLNLAGTVAITPAYDSAVGGISYFKDTHHPSSGKKRNFKAEPRRRTSSTSQKSTTTRVTIITNLIIRLANLNSRVDHTDDEHHNKECTSPPSTKPPQTIHLPCSLSRPSSSA